MNKKTITIIIIILILGLGLKFLTYNTENKTEGNTSLQNISVMIGDESFNLINGKAEKEYTPGSATKNKLSIFGEPVMGDLDKDGDSDGALLLVNDAGGSGTFYYAVLAINTNVNNNTAYKTTNAMLLGDRIAPQTVEIHEGRAVYNYAERKGGESFATAPSVGKSLWVHFDVKNNEIGEWVKDFEGEANPKTMKLPMKKWIWVKTEMSDGKLITPKKPDAFTLTFKDDGNFSASTDCNGVGSSYKTNGNEIEFTKMMSTLMYCEGSQEQEFSKSLGEVGSYMFTSKGELVLMIKMDSGSMIFR